MALISAGRYLIQMAELSLTLQNCSNLQGKPIETDSQQIQPSIDRKKQPSDGQQIQKNNIKHEANKLKEQIQDWPDLSQQPQKSPNIDKEELESSEKIKEMSQQSSNLQIIVDECPLNEKSFIYPSSNQQCNRPQSKNTLKNSPFDASCSSINSQSKAIRKATLQISQSFIRSQNDEREISQDSSLYYSSDFVSYDSMGIPKEEGMVIALPTLQKEVNEQARTSPFKTTIVRQNSKKTRNMEEKKEDAENSSLSYDQIITFEPVKKCNTLKKTQTDIKSQSMKEQPISDPCFQKKNLNFYDNQDREQPQTNPTANQTNVISPYDFYNPYQMQRQMWNNQLYPNPSIYLHNTTYPLDHIQPYLQSLPYNPINREILRELPKPVLASKAQSEAEVKKEKQQMERPANPAGRICYPEVCISMSNCLLKLTACKLLRMHSDILLFPIIGADFSCYPAQFFKVTSPEFSYCTRRIPLFTEGVCDFVEAKEEENFKTFAFLKLSSDKDKGSACFVKGVKNLLESYQSENGELKSLIIPFCKAYGWSGKFLDSVFAFLEKGKEFKFKSITIICSHPSEYLLLMQRFSSYFQYLANESLIVL